MIAASGVEHQAVAGALPRKRKTNDAALTYSPIDFDSSAKTHQADDEGSGQLRMFASSIR